MARCIFNCILSANESLPSSFFDIKKVALLQERYMGVKIAIS
jgi:hypothetical protein